MPRERREIPWLKVRDGVYYVYWYDKASNRTKRISLNTRESVEAQASYAAFLSGGHEIFGSGRQLQLGVATALDQYLREHVAEKVISKGRTESVAALLKQWFKNTAFQDVDIPASRAYTEARMSGKLVAPGKGIRKGRGGHAVSGSTARRELGLLVAAANHAARWKRIGPKASPPTPMPSIELPPDGTHREVYLTKPELELAISSLNPLIASGDDGAKAALRLQDFIQITYGSAARRRSVERLTRFQVNLRFGTINLTSPRETPLELASKKRRPVVPISAKMRPIIERRMIEAEAAGVEWLWLTPTSMYRVFAEHLTAIGLAKKAFPHVLRHSRATHLLQAGVPIFHVAKLLGDTIATVERVYGHHIPADLALALAEDM